MEIILIVCYNVIRTDDGGIKMDYRQKYEQWLQDCYFDEATKDELRSIAVNEKEIEERFYKNLEFGTGGLRGVLGAGTNRMNIYTVRKATQGLANYILKQTNISGAKMGVVIAHDSRRLSREFAETAALTLCGNGIKAYLFDSLRPTPVLSFAIRRLGCVSGIVITASHNPPEYNGYKCYWLDGAQVPYPRDEAIIGEVNSITAYAAEIKSMEMDEALKSGMLTVLDGTVDDDYNNEVMKQIINKDVIEKMAEDFRIVYTPLNGTGNVPVRRALAEAGFKHIYVVPEQEQPDPNFTTVEYPNPEDPKAFALARALADEVDADIIIATDPDADRMGAIVKNEAGGYVILTGNQMGVLMANYIIEGRKRNGTMPANPATVTSVVSTDMTSAIAAANDIAYFEVLTGFKYIGEKIKEFEEENSYNYVYGFEESYGCLAGTHARDKDGVVASMLMCEIAAFCKSKGRSVETAMDKLYEKYGYYKEHIESITLRGKDGIAVMAQIMSNLRENPPVKVNGTDVTETRDYLKQAVYKGGSETPTGLPVSNVLYYVLADGSWFCIRPSGTEPKIKIYFGVKGVSHGDADAKVKALAAAAMEVVERSKPVQ
jgi:phosphoglucomutase